MCRLFAYIGHEKALLEDVLVNPTHALVHQVHDHYLPGLVHSHPNEPPRDVKAARKEADERNKFFNIDGFGVAFYTNTAAEFNDDINGPRPSLYKSVAPPITDPTFLSLCANISSHVVVGHVRATSLSSVVSTNCHPFAFGRHVFAHNGYIKDFDKVRREISMLIKAEYFAGMRGTTDSEHMAALYMTHLDVAGGGKGDAAERAFTIREMRDALAKTIKNVQEVQTEIVKGEELDNAINDLNLVTSEDVVDIIARSDALLLADGERLVAVRWRNHPEQQPPSLYISTSAGITLNRKYPDHPHGGDPRAAVRGNAKEHLKQRKPKVDKEEHGLHVIVASEPTTFRPNEWMLLDKNHVVMVDESMNPIVEELHL